MDCSMSSLPMSWSLLKFMSIELKMLSKISSSAITFSFYLQSFPASGSFPVSWLFISGDPNWSFSISPANEYSGLISFKMDWFDLLAVQGTLKSLLQHYSSKPSVLQCSAFFLVQYPYMTSFLVHTHAWLLEKPYLWLDRPLLAKWCLCFFIHCLDLS